ncbi:MAG: Asp-tRNA(Asn)/Glu-tRNA(Gln) amidotransferase subunit GatA [Burkholderiaceae bacterium]
MHNDSLEAIAQALRSRKISSVELTQLFLDRIEEQADLNAFISVDAEVSLAQAHAADARIASGDATPLTGIPIAHKDIFTTREFRSTAGSRMLENYRSPFDATVVQRLGIQSPGAGMVTIGKANCDEFAMGSSNENSFFGPVKNPWDRRAISGGTSGGSAALVAARLAPAATGTDTGGSIRQPASMCGVTGIKPTYGRVSRWGMIAFASSLDQGGVLAKSAADCALVLNHMAGFDERDSTSVERVREDFGREFLRPIDGLRIGLPREYFGEGVHTDVAHAVQAALAQYERLGARLVDISLPRTELSIPAYYVIAPAEASSNLSRFDGARYGHRAQHYGDLLEMYERTRAEGFGWEVKRRILVGTYVLSHGYYDAYYVQAQKIRRLIAEDFRSAFRDCDVIATPVAPTVAWDIGEKTDDPVANYLADIFTLSVSLAGLPGLSVPCGFGAQQRPIGLQLIANYFDEARLLGAAHQFQKATDWHLRSPHNGPRVDPASDSETKR